MTPPRKLDPTASAQLADQVERCLRAALAGQPDLAQASRLGLQLAQRGGRMVDVITTYRRLLDAPEAPDAPAPPQLGASLELLQAFAEGFARFTVIRRDAAAHPAAALESLRPPGSAQPTSAEAQRMEMLGRLAGGIAHDFNNLLTAIVCFTRFVKDDLAEGDPAHDDLAEVLRAADTATGLIHQLLYFVRDRPPSPATVNLADAVNDACRMLRRLLGASVQITVSAPERPLYVEMDPAQLTQIIMNLAINARDAMPHGGKLGVQIDAIGAPGRDGVFRGFARLRVADSGQGIDPEVLPRIFDPFFTTKGDHGTGLGLATCKDLVSQAGGRISAESVAGQGSTFSVLLPEVPSPEASLVRRRESPRPQPPASQRTVLVVDDNPELLRAMIRALQQEGFSVLSAQSAEEALQIVQAQRADLALAVVDVVLPAADGVQLVSRLRADHGAMRTLMISGSVGEEAVPSSEAAAGTDFLPKPFSRALLVERVRQLMKTV